MTRLRLNNLFYDFSIQVNDPIDILGCTLSALPLGKGWQMIATILTILVIISNSLHMWVKFIWVLAATRCQELQSETAQLHPDSKGWVT